jgi:hypothetical protein
MDFRGAFLAEGGERSELEPWPLIILKSYEFHVAVANGTASAHFTFCPVIHENRKPGRPGGLVAVPLSTPDFPQLL